MSEIERTKLEMRIATLEADLQAQYEQLRDRLPDLAKRKQSTGADPC